MLGRMETLALTELLGRPVLDAAGNVSGRVREVAIAPQEDRHHVALLVVKTSAGDCILQIAQLRRVNGGRLEVSSPRPEWAPFNTSEGLLMLERDLLDQQIIDVNGRKVVRVNDAELLQERRNGHVELPPAGPLTDHSPFSSVKVSFTSFSLMIHSPKGIHFASCQ